MPVRPFRHTRACVIRSAFFLFGAVGCGVVGIWFLVFTLFVNERRTVHSGRVGVFICKQ